MGSRAKAQVLVEQEGWSEARQKALALLFVIKSHRLSQLGEIKEVAHWRAD
jgi:hypothetical protein